MVVTLADLVFSTDVLSRNNLKPWWETIRGYAVGVMLGASLFMLYQVDPEASIHCKPLNETSSKFTSQDIIFFNTRCYDQMEFLLKYNRFIAVAGAMLTYLAYTWWLMVPRVINGFDAVREADEMLKTLKLLPSQMEKLVRRELDIEHRDIKREQPRRTVLDTEVVKKSESGDKYATVQNALRKLWIRGSRNGNGKTKPKLECKDCSSRRNPGSEHYILHCWRQYPLLFRIFTQSFLLLYKEWIIPGIYLWRNLIGLCVLFMNGIFLAFYFALHGQSSYTCSSHQFTLDCSFNVWSSYLPYMIVFTVSIVIQSAFTLIGMSKTVLCTVLNERECSETFYFSIKENKLIEKFGNASSGLENAKYYMNENNAYLLVTKMKHALPDAILNSDVDFEDLVVSMQSKKTLRSLCAEILIDSYGKVDNVDAYEEKIKFYARIAHLCYANKIYDCFIEAHYKQTDHRSVDDDDWFSGMSLCDGPSFKLNDLDENKESLMYHLLYNLSSGRWVTRKHLEPYKLLKCTVGCSCKDPTTEKKLVVYKYGRKKETPGEFLLNQCKENQEMFVYFWIWLKELKLIWAEDEAELSDMQKEDIKNKEREALNNPKLFYSRDPVVDVVRSQPPQHPVRRLLAVQNMEKKFQRAIAGHVDALWKQESKLSPNITTCMSSSLPPENIHTRTESQDKKHHETRTVQSHTEKHQTSSPGNIPSTSSFKLQDEIEQTRPSDPVVEDVRSRTPKDPLRRPLEIQNLEKERQRPSTGHLDTLEAMMQKGESESNLSPNITTCTSSSLPPENIHTQGESQGKKHHETRTAQSHTKKHQTSLPGNIPSTSKHFSSFKLEDEIEQTGPSDPFVEYVRSPIPEDPLRRLLEIQGLNEEGGRNEAEFLDVMLQKWEQEGNPSPYTTSCMSSSLPPENIHTQNLEEERERTWIEEFLEAGEAIMQKGEQEINLLLNTTTCMASSLPPENIHTQGEYQDMKRQETRTAQSHTENHQTFSSCDIPSTSKYSSSFKLEDEIEQTEPSDTREKANEETMPLLQNPRKQHQEES